MPYNRIIAQCTKIYKCFCKVFENLDNIYKKTDVLSYHKPKISRAQNIFSDAVKKNCTVLENLYVLWYTIMVYFLMKGGDCSDTDYISRRTEGTTVFYEACVCGYTYV